jgi:N-methylhydantoinase A/oxoprolinase/acetone carboxylase beta subunit
MYRIGVDVGGTNTDAAILDVTALDTDTRGVLATCKTSTTSQVTLGIQAAIKDVLAKSKVDRTKVLNVAIGTTHFVNAVVENDARRLNRVAVIRLCGPYTRKVNPLHWTSHLLTYQKRDTFLLRLPICIAAHRSRPDLLPGRRP